MFSQEKVSILTEKLHKNHHHQSFAAALTMETMRKKASWELVRDQLVLRYARDILIFYCSASSGVLSEKCVS